MLHKGSHESSQFMCDPPAQPSHNTRQQFRGITVRSISPYFSQPASLAHVVSKADNTITEGWPQHPSPQAGSTGSRLCLEGMENLTWSNLSRQALHRASCGWKQCNRTCAIPSGQMMCGHPAFPL